jgi:hypothetical protein
MVATYTCWPIERPNAPLTVARMQVLQPVCSGLGTEKLMFVGALAGRNTADMFDFSMFRTSGEASEVAVVVLAARGIQAGRKVFPGSTAPHPPNVAAKHKAANLYQVIATD